MSNDDTVQIRVPALKHMVELFLIKAEDSYKASMWELRKKYVPKMTARRWFGLVAPKYINPTDQEVIEYFGDLDTWSWDALFVYYWIERQALAATLLAMGEVSADGNVMISSKTFYKLSN